MFFVVVFFSKSKHVGLITGCEALQSGIKGQIRSLYAVASIVGDVFKEAEFFRGKWIRSLIQDN